MELAPDFELPDENGTQTRLSDLWKQSPLLLVFYPGDFTPVCTAQLCDYRDSYDEFRGMGVKIVGISPDEPSKHRSFAKEFQFPFTLLSDPKKEVVNAFGCASRWSLGIKNRAVCLVNDEGNIVWRHVEPFAITRRRASELKEIISDLIQRGAL